MEKIKMVDLQQQYLRIKPEIDAAIQEVLDSTAFIQGPQVAQFAKALAEYTGAKYVIPCANGTDALQVAMMALGYKPGRKVIKPGTRMLKAPPQVVRLNSSPRQVPNQQDQARSRSKPAEQGEAEFVHQSRA